jgi:hypothetical protein
MGAIPIVGEVSFIFSFVSYGLVTKSLGVGCKFEEVEQKTKRQKMKCETFYNQIQMIHLTSFLRGKIP